MPFQIHQPKNKRIYPKKPIQETHDNFETKKLASHSQSLDMIQREREVWLLEEDSDVAKLES
jgi:hypothetical protein